MPEGEHASEASIEVEFRGEVTDLSEKERWDVVDLCYQCKLCDPVCPYTPGKEHEFQLDFPKLMTRAQAIRTKDRGVKVNDIFLAKTDFTGKIGTSFSYILNFFNRVGFIRKMMQVLIGIHSNRILPEFANQSFKNWFEKETLL